MNNAKRAVVRTRKFVRDHKTAIAVVATIVVMEGVMQVGLRQHDNFLREHGLYDEFYRMTDED